MNNKLNKGGFTLIELLVVVLIIGILSSIALPQYTKAVEKSRAAEAMAFLGDWVTAQTIYKMANGQFASDEGVLDITLPKDQLKYFSATQTGGGLTGTTPKAVLMTMVRQGSSTAYTLQVKIANVASDGSNTITRQCKGDICETIISGLKQTSGSGGNNGQWAKGTTDLSV